MSEHDNEILNTDNEKYIPFKLITANARSLPSKITSLIDCFAELELYAAALTETWITDKKEHRKDLEDILARGSIGFILKNRGSRGGGVAIAYDTRKILLTEHKMSGNKYEMVCGIGKIRATNQVAVVVSLYIPPRQKSDTTKKMIECLADNLSVIISRHENPLIFVAGDTNNRDIGSTLSDLPNMRELTSAGTRKGARLDIACTNFDAGTLTIPPLEEENGTRSDHDILLIESKILRQKFCVKYVINKRRMRQEDIEKFNGLMITTNWEVIRTGDPSSSTDRLQSLLSAYTESCFPRRKITIKSVDKPWMTERIRRETRRKRLIYRREGRSDRWWRQENKTGELIRARKINFADGVKTSVKEAGNMRAYYQAIKKLQVADGPSSPAWSIQQMFPGRSNDEIAELGANFFNAISQEFTPLPAPDPPAVPREAIPAYRISARLKSFRKTKGQVIGDIDSSLINHLSDIISLPLQIIFSEVYSTNKWPKIWKTETVHLIPKSPSPSSLSELRNLSCTPMFSKVLESFILEDLKKETQLSDNQYGGRKGCSTDHFLIDMWQDILGIMDDNRASANIISIDFEKAFNRLDHAACIKSLKEGGASAQSIGLVSAFLHGRTMSVKVGSAMSTERAVSGGSPQGSILGNYLFCHTTDKLDMDMEPLPSGLPHGIAGNGEDSAHTSPLRPPLAPIRRPDSTQPVPHPSTPTTSKRAGTTSTPSARGQFAAFKPPGNLSSNIDSPYSSDSDSDVPPFVKFNRPFVLESSDSGPGEDEEIAMREEYGANVPRWKDEPISVRKYIDDFSAVEKIANFNARMQLSTEYPKLLAEAKKSGHLFVNMSAKSTEKGMKINPRKTQVLCISASLFQVSSFVRAGENIMSSTDTMTMKILGFMFGNKPNVGYQVDYLVLKFRRRLWSIYHLKRSGMSVVDLVFI